MSQPRQVYEQQLSRSLRVLSNVAITISAVTPASSVFIIVPLLLLMAGTGSLLALLFAGAIGVVMAFCWAELSAAFPIAGGDYAVVWHAFKGRARPLAGPVSMVTFALVLTTIVFIPAVIALGAAQYLGVVWAVDERWAGAAVMVLAAGVAILNVRLNAVLTGVFLAVELGALVLVTALGLLHVQPGRLSRLFSGWEVGTAGGGVEPVSLGAICAATAVAVFAYNGYAGALFLAEETQGSSRGIARAILWSLVITVAAEVIPSAAVLLGAPDLGSSSTSATLMNDFLLASGGPALNTAVSLVIALAILNAVIAVALQLGRALYASGRDRAWPGPLSDAMCAVSARFQTPWFATALIGVVGAALCLTVPLNTLIALTGANLVLNYAFVAVAALVGRATGATDGAPYRMPGWPLPPLLAIAALGYVTWQQSAEALTVTALTIAGGLGYWALVIWPQRGRAWVLRDPIFADAPAAAPAALAADPEPAAAAGARRALPR